jgi:uncharacterized protein YndB with AHSA1/START domain
MATPTIPDPAATTVERVGDCEVSVTRVLNGPARLVYRAWTEAELFRRWWVPASFGLTLLSCEMDVRVGGTYRLVFEVPGGTMAFFGTYVEVEPERRLVWTNEEDEAGQIVTTVTFAEQEGRTHVAVHDRYPSKEVLEAAIATGSVSSNGLPESLAQLEALLVDPAGLGA